MSTTTTTAVTGPLVASGVTPLPFDFQAIDADEVAVTLDGVLVSSDDYNVDLQPDGTGTVTPSASWTGEVYIYSDPAYGNPTAFSRTGPFHADYINAPLDRLARQIIALKSTVARAPIISFGETLASDYAGKYIGVNASGRVVPLDETDTGMLRSDLADPASGASLVSVQVGSVERTVASKLSEGVSVLDYGAVGDAATDNAAALQAAVDAAQAASVPLYFPGGVYRSVGQVKITQPIALVGDGAAEIVFSDAITYPGGIDGSGGFDVLDVTGISFEGLKVVSEETTEISACIHFRGCSEIKVNNCTFSNPGSIDGSKCLIVQRSPNVSQVRNVSITSNQFIGSPNACLVIGEAAEPPTNIVIDGNIVEGRAVAFGACFKVDKYVTNCVISNNTINGNDYADEGITLEQASNHVSIIGNTITGIAQYAVKLTDDATAALAYRNVLIANNHITNSGTAQGIRLLSSVPDAGTNIVVRDNVVVGGTIGIYDGDGNIKNLIVAGNAVLDCTATAIILKSAGAVVTGNVVKGAESIYSYSAGGASGQRIIDNIFDQNNGNAACDINYGSAHGSDTIMRGNIGLRANGERLSAGTVTLAPGVAVSELYTSGGAITATLPNGTYVGQRKMIHHASGGSINSSTVSVTNHATSDPEVFTFAARNSTLILEWMGNEWITVANSGVTV